MSDQERINDIEQLEEIQEKRMLVSLKESQTKSPGKQLIHSVYSEGKSRTISPNFIRIENIQNLSEQERNTLNSIIKKLQNKLKIEFSSNQTNSNKENNENQHTILPHLLGRVRSKESDPSLSIDDDPRESSEQYKFEMFRNLLIKATEQSKEKDFQIRQLQLTILELKAQNTVQEERCVQDQVQREQYQKQSWEEEKSQLLRKYNSQIDELNQKLDTQRKDYQSQLSILRNRLQEYELKEKTHSQADQQNLKEYSKKIEQLRAQVLNKNREILNTKAKSKNLESEVSAKRQEIETYLLQRSKLEQRITQLKSKVQLLQQQSKSETQRFQNQLTQAKLKQAQKILFYKEKLSNCQAKLRQSKEDNSKDAQRISKLEDKLKEYEQLSRKAKLEMQENEKKKNAILPQIQKQLTQYMKEFDNLQTQKQNVHTRNELLQRELATYQTTVQQLTQYRAKLEEQVKNLQQYKQQSQKHSLNLQKQISQLKNAKTQVQNSKEKYVNSLSIHENIIKSKDIKIKLLEQKSEKLQIQLQKTSEQAKKIQNQARKSASYEAEVRKIQALKVQSANKIRMLEQESAAIKANLKKELSDKIQYYESQLKRAKIEKEKWQNRCIEQSKKNSILIEQSKKTRESNIKFQDPQIVDLKKVKSSYEGQIQLKNNQLRSQKIKFEEILRIKQRELAEKNQKIESMMQKSRQSQALTKFVGEKESKESKLSSFFDLLKGFKAKMSPAQFNSLRSRISFMMN